MHCFIYLNSHISALIYETLITISTIEKDDALITLATKCVARFLSAKQINLKYIGMHSSSKLFKLLSIYFILMFQILNLQQAWMKTNNDDK